MGVTFPIEVAADSRFPISNIPFGIFSTEANPSKRVGTAIGDSVLDLSILEQHGVFSDCLDGEANGTSQVNGHATEKLFSQPTLNSFAAKSATYRSAIRQKIISLLKDGGSVLFSHAQINASAFYKMSEAKMHLPMQIGDFTDFMCSRTHSDNCAHLSGFTTPAAFYAMPTAYNGRASSVIPTGTAIHRPRGILKVPATNSFEFAPCKRMDFELEMGFFISQPVPFGQPIRNADDAKAHIFGFVMLNDWSARDIQFAEMVPLGPFNGKGSGTTISCWVVTLDAMEGAETASADEIAVESMSQQPAHFKHAGPATWNIEVSVELRREGYEAPVTIVESNLRDLYWGPLQMLSHHASAGCGLRTGDLCGTGTISQPPKGKKGISNSGCMFESTLGGKQAFEMVNGKSLMWLEDGDEVGLVGKVVRGDGSSIGFGDCKGVLLASAE